MDSFATHSHIKTQYLPDQNFHCVQALKNKNSNDKKQWFYGNGAIESTLPLKEMIKGLIAEESLLISKLAGHLPVLSKEMYHDYNFN